MQQIYIRIKMIKNFFIILVLNKIKIEKRDIIISGTFMPLESKKEIFETLSKIVAGIDFPEDVAEPEYSYLISSFEKSLKEIDEILACAKSSDILR